MTSITFDTLKYAERLEEAGIPREHAKVFAEMQKDALSDVMDAQELATKGDLREMRVEIKGEFNRIEGEFKRIEGELKLNRWMLVLVIAATVAPLLKTLFS